MLDKIKKEISKPLSSIGLDVDSINYEKGNLNIILDSEDVIDLDKIVEATRIINDILDAKDFIKEKYILDVSSKEKGGSK
ncbi:MAG: ribosome maturation factor RimP [Bacilli bacterium]